MASRKSRNIYIPKCFKAVRNCINILVLYLLEVHLLTFSYISANYVTTGIINSSSYFFLFLKEFCFRFDFFFKQFELTAVGMDSTSPEIKTPCRMVVEC